MTSWMSTSCRQARSLRVGCSLSGAFSSIFLGVNSNCQFNRRALADSSNLGKLGFARLRWKSKKIFPEELMLTGGLVQQPVQTAASAI